MSIPAIIVLSMYALHLLVAANMHGKFYKSGKFNFWSTLLTVLISAGLLWWGGFFS